MEGEFHLKIKVETMKADLLDNKTRMINHQTDQITWEHKNIEKG